MIAYYKTIILVFKHSSCIFMTKVLDVGSVRETSEITLGQNSGTENISFYQRTSEFEHGALSRV